MPRTIRAVRSKARRTVRCKPCTRLLLTFTWFSIISFLWEKTSSCNQGSFSCKQGLKSNRKCGIIDGQFLQRLLRVKPQGSFFIFSAILKTAIVEYHKSNCNQSRGVQLTRSWKEKEKGGRGIYIIYNYKHGRIYYQIIDRQSFYFLCSFRYRYFIYMAFYLKLTERYNTQGCSALQTPAPGVVLSGCCRLLRCAAP